MARQVDIDFKINTSKAVTELDKVLKAFKNLNDEHSKITNNKNVKISGLGSAKDEINKLSSEISKLTNNLEKASKKASSGIGGGNYTKKAKEATGVTGDLKKALFGVSLQYSLMTKGIQLATQAMSSYISSSLELENSTYKLGVASQMSVKQIETLKSSMLELSKGTPVMAQELATGADMLVRAGLDYKDAMQIAIDTGKLAIASSEDMASTMQVVQKIFVAFSIDGEHAGQALDALHSTAIQSATSMGGLAEAFKQSAGSLGVMVDASGLAGEKLNIYKQSVLETGSAMIGTLQNMGRSASQSGTKVRILVSRLVAMENSARKLFEARMLEQGVTVDPNTMKQTSDGIRLTQSVLADMAKKDLPKTIQLLSELTAQGKLTQKELAKMFTTRHFLDIQKVLLSINGDIDEFNNRISRGVSVVGDYEKQMYNLNNQMKTLKNNLLSLTGGATTAIKGELGFILYTVNSIIESIDKVPDWIKGTFVTLHKYGGGIGSILNLINKVFDKKGYIEEEEFSNFRNEIGSTIKKIGEMDNALDVSKAQAKVVSESIENMFESLGPKALGGSQKGIIDSILGDTSTSGLSKTINDLYETSIPSIEKLTGPQLEELEKAKNELIAIQSDIGDTEKLKSRYKELTKVLSDQSEVYDEYKRKYDKLTDTEQESAKGQTIRAQMVEAKTAINSAGKELKSFKDNYNKLITSEKAVQDILSIPIKKAEQDFNNYSKLLNAVKSNYDKTITDLKMKELEMGAGVSTPQEYISTLLGEGGEEVAVDVGINFKFLSKDAMSDTKITDYLKSYTGLTITNLKASEKLLALDEEISKAKKSQHGLLGEDLERNRELIDSLEKQRKATEEIQSYATKTAGQIIKNSVARNKQIKDEKTIRAIMLETFDVNSKNFSLEEFRIKAMNTGIEREKMLLQLKLDQIDAEKKLKEESMNRIEGQLDKLGVKSPKEYLSKKTSIEGMSELSDDDAKIYKLLEDYYKVKNSIEDEPLKLGYELAIDSEKIMDNYQKVMADINSLSGKAPKGKVEASKQKLLSLFGGDIGGPEDLDIEGVIEDATNRVGELNLKIKEGGKLTRDEMSELQEKNKIVKAGVDYLKAQYDVKKDSIKLDKENAKLLIKMSETQMGPYASDYSKSTAKIGRMKEVFGVSSDADREKVLSVISSLQEEYNDLLEKGENISAEEVLRKEELNDKIEKGIDLADEMNNKEKERLDLYSQMGSSLSEIGDILGVDMLSNMGDLMSTGTELFETFKSLEGVALSSAEGIAGLMSAFSSGAGMGSQFSQMFGGAGGASSSMLGGVGSMAGMYIGGPAGAMAGSAIGGMLGGMFDEDTQAEANKLNEENNKLYAENTTALQELNQNMQSLSSGIDNLNLSLVSSVSAMPTMDRIQDTISGMEDIYKKILTTRDFEDVAYQVEKSISSGGFLGIGGSSSKYIKTYEKSVKEMLKIYGYHGDIMDMTNDQLRDFAKWLDDYDRGVSDNFSDLARAIEAYVEALEDMERQMDDMFRDATMEAFKGISSIDQTALIEKIEGIYKDLGIAITPEIREEIEDIADKMSQMVTVMENVRTGFVDSWAKSGESAGEAFLTSMNSYMSDLMNNISQVYYDVYFSDINKQLENSFKEIAEELVKLKKEGDKLDWDDMFDGISDSWEDIIEAIKESKEQTENFNEVLEQMQKKALELGLSLSDLKKLGLLTGTQEEILETFENAMTSGDAESVFEEVGSMIGDKVGKAMSDKMIDELYSDEILNFAKYMDQVLSGDMNFDNLVDLANKGLALSLELEDQAKKMEAIMDLFDYNQEISYLNENQNIEYQTGTTQSIVNNYYLSSKVEAGTIVESDSVEDLAKELVDDLLEIMVDKGYIQR